MRYGEFTERIKEEIKELLPETVEDITLFPVLKNNGVKYTGLVVKEKSNISPTIYLDPYFHQYASGRSFDAILADVAKTYNENRVEEDFDISVVRKWEYAKERIVRKAVNFEQNKDLLNDTPHKVVEDLAIIYQVYLSDVMSDYATVTITNQFMKEWDVSEEDLEGISLENTRKLLPPRMDKMSDIYEEITGVEIPFLENMNMYILTNEVKINGAVYALDADVMETMAEAIGTKEYYVIPSSIHEVILLPLDDKYTRSEIEQMIREVNATELRDEEILSDRLYVYDSNEKKIMLAAKYEEYKKNQELNNKFAEVDAQEPEQKIKL